MGINVKKLLNFGGKINKNLMEEEKNGQRKKRK